VSILAAAASIVSASIRSSVVTFKKLTTWEWIRQNDGKILRDVGEHMELTVIAVVIGFAISLPLALLIRRYRGASGPVYGVAGALYAIPSLALFAFFIPITGLTKTTAEIGLVSYTLLILIRNIVTGLDGVPEEVRDAATGVGYSPTERLFRVDFPMAVPTIISGIRIATVTTIGLVTIASVVGAGGGLGTLITEGQQNGFRGEVLVGAVLSVALAVVFDLILVVLGRLATPWARRRAGAGA
jgi:osmoprotectant transport system permease protein